MSIYEAVVTRNGRITIPANIRRELGIEPGDRIVVEQIGDTIRLTRALSIVERTAGCLAKYGQGRMLSSEEETEAFERGVAEEVVESMNRS